MCHESEKWSKIWRVIYLSVQNWHEFMDLTNLTRALGNVKNLHFNGQLLTKVYNTWAKKSTEELCFMALKIDAKFEAKLTIAFFVYRLKNSDIILASKVMELNQNKNSKQPDRPDPVWKLYFTLEINE